MKEAYNYLESYLNFVIGLKSLKFSGYYDWELVGVNVRKSIAEKETVVDIICIDNSRQISSDKLKDLIPMYEFRR